MRGGYSGRLTFGIKIERYAQYIHLVENFNFCKKEKKVWAFLGEYFEEWENYQRVED